MPTVWPTGADVWNQWTTINIQTAGTNIWPIWANQIAGTNIWPIWANQIVTGTQANTVWVNWQTSSSIGFENNVIGPSTVSPVPLTPEQIAERDARRERDRRERARFSLIHRNRERARMLRRKPAMRAAEALLLEQLSPAQREEWKTERAFTVHTADGKRAYKIAYGLAGNVRLVKADEAPRSKHGLPLRVGARFCMHVYHPDGWVPNEDNVLAQKLLIESNEEHFLALANVS